MLLATSKRHDFENAFDHPIKIIWNGDAYQSSRRVSRLEVRKKEQYLPSAHAVRANLIPEGLISENFFPGANVKIRFGLILMFLFSLLLMSCSSGNILF